MFLLFLGETLVRSTISLRDYQYDGSKGTTPLLTKSGPPRTPSEFHNLPSTLLFILVVLVGVFIIICGLFVGAYFYKHCNTRTYSNKSRRVDPISNQREVYNSLEMNVHEQSIHSRDQTYLEPVSDAKKHYEEILSLNETTEQICKPISEETEFVKVSPKLQSCCFSSAKRFKRSLIDKHSL